MKNSLIRLSLAAGLLCIAGCQKPTTTQRVITMPIAQAQNQAAYEQHEAFAARLHFTWGSDYRFDGTLLYDLHTMQAKLTDLNGTVTVYDGSNVWVAPKAKASPQNRHDVTAWPWYVAAPFTLHDKGVMLKEVGREPLFGVWIPAATLSRAGTKPDHAYLIYRDPATNTLAAIGGITTHVGDDMAANPQAIVYSDFQRVQDVSLATTWVFYNWSKTDGPTGAPLGRATLTDLRFLDGDDAKAADFTAPKDAVMVKP